MKKVGNDTKCFAQGDILFTRVNEVPNGYVGRREQNVVVAHSETGHNHTVNGPPGNDYRPELFTKTGDEMVSYLKVQPGSKLEHHRQFDTHETVLFDSERPTIWKINRQRERTPEGWRRIED